MVYDFAIIGAGAAGLQLALAMAKDQYFNSKQIVIFEPDSKTVNDKTWSFWEKGSGHYDNILAARWDTALFYGGGQSLNIPLRGYSYKSLRALDFYNYAKSELQKHNNIHWIEEKIEELQEEEVIHLTGKQQYQAAYVFDSRIPITSEEIQTATGVLQHFLGWEIKTPCKVFDPKSFTMMDYRIKYEDTSSFTYVLPYSETEALVEFTFFSPDLVKREDYEILIRRYIKEQLNIKNFEITAKEGGVIPMFDYPFQKHITERVIKVGTAGGWVKPSSGYSFKSSGNKSQKLIQNIKNKQPLTKGIYSKKHLLYDSTFLKVLQRENHLGEDLFTIMYSKNDIETVFAFLDEETSFVQEVALMNTFPKAKFGMAMASVVLKA